MSSLYISGNIFNFHSQLASTDFKRSVLAKHLRATRSCGFYNGTNIIRERNVHYNYYISNEMIFDNN